MSEDRHETKRIFCNWCARCTNHVLRAGYARPRIVGEGEQPGEIRTSIWSCAGCDEESFEWLFIPIDDEPPGPTYFPPRSEDLPQDLIQPKPFTNLSPKLKEIYAEVIRCFNMNCLVLCTIGTGALLEGICAEKGLTGKTRINDLHRFVPNLNVIEALIEFVDARNDAAHRLDPRPRNEARLAIEVMEDLMSFLYDLDYKAVLARSGSRKAAFDSIKPDRVQ